MHWLFQKSLASTQKIEKISRLRIITFQVLKNLSNQIIFKGGLS